MRRVKPDEIRQAQRFTDAGLPILTEAEEDRRLELKADAEADMAAEAEQEDR